MLWKLQNEYFIRDLLGLCMVVKFKIRYIPEISVIAQDYTECLFFADIKITYKFNCALNNVDISRLKSW